ncbi:MAG: hydrogenase, partial [Elusimicrobia bacterium]|nr:hydrogenase [Elusimicrobiota bacterium]
MFDILRLNLKTGLPTEVVEPGRPGEFELVGAQLKSKLARLGGGRSLNIRQVDAGSCNACELEAAALANPFYDLERFGIHFVAS